MSQPTNPPGSPPRTQAPSSPMPLSEDYSDYEGDPTSINQIPPPPIVASPPSPPNGNPPNAPMPTRAPPLHPTPSAQPAPNQFASASPSLSHIGAPLAPYAASGLGHNAAAPPGP